MNVLIKSDSITAAGRLPGVFRSLLGRPVASVSASPVRLRPPDRKLFSMASARTRTSPRRKLRSRLNSTFGFCTRPRTCRSLHQSAK